eukprot:403341142
MPNKYIITKALGKGSYANVSLAYKWIHRDVNGIQQNDKKYYAVKSIQKNIFDDGKTTIEQMMDEIDIHRKLELCGNAIKLYKVYESQTQLHMLIEYQEGGTLLDQIKKQIKYTEVDIRTIMAQLLLAVDFMHKKGVVHRDIKLDNILLSSMTLGVFDVRIADFGLAAHFKPGELLTQKCGTPTYIGPEVLNGSGYTEKVDIFSLGSIMFNLVSGKYLFQGKDQNALLKLNLICDLSHIDNYINTISVEGQALLIKLLERNPLLRPSAKDALEHPWFFQDRGALIDGLLMNNYLCEIDLKRHSFIHESMLNKMSAKISMNIHSQADAAKIGSNLFIRSHQSGNSLSSFFIKSRQFSQSNSSNKQQNDLPQIVSYYKILVDHRRSRSSNPSRLIFGNSMDQSLNQLKVQKRNNSNEEQKRNLLLEKNRSCPQRSKFSKIKLNQQVSKNESKQAMGDEPILLNVSLASDSNRGQLDQLSQRPSIQRGRQMKKSIRLHESIRSNSDDWNNDIGKNQC